MGQYRPSRMGNQLAKNMEDAMDGVFFRDRGVLVSAFGSPHFWMVLSFKGPFCF